MLASSLPPPLRAVLYNRLMQKDLTDRLNSRARRIERRAVTILDLYIYEGEPERFETEASVVGA
jgi:hypothetical protein